MLDMEAYAYNSKTWEVEAARFFFQFWTSPAYRTRLSLYKPEKGKGEKNGKMEGEKRKERETGIGRKQ